MSIWHDLLRVVIHTPSPHNVQPWRVKIINDLESELYIDSTRTLPKEDVTGSFIISTMGMFIAALEIVANSRNLHIDFDLINEPEKIAPLILESTTPTLIPFARLKLAPGKESDEVYCEELFLKRRTSRLKLKVKPVPEKSINILCQIAKDWRHNFSITTKGPQIERLLQINTDALFEDLNSAIYHDEIVAWFRYTKKQSLEHLDGLDARCMNTSPLNCWLVANVPRLLLLPIAKQLMAKIYRSQLGDIPTLGILSGQFWDPEASLDAGRFLMRFWLETARQNLYIHPYGNLVTNHKAAAAVEKELDIKNIWLIFKIGYSDEPPKSHRLPVERILI